VVIYHEVFTVLGSPEKALTFNVIAQFDETG
jgi:hypothetical protein